VNLQKIKTCKKMTSNISHNDNGENLFI